ncbi:putative metal-dependent hydrolase [Natronospira proteinivora]|uniref:Metal-dependent hydrolase n=1 Tax=Natronospira proteinivora TaxID=1807133 RepID=A0ABT1G738_9GAMM|nr:SprT family zinc-dependent metalloprotease [Natronospira proteinivora]MCP1726775.1 putative metal-dependent hydrolase [Natronospira proteinivora]
MRQALPKIQWRRSRRARRLKLALCPWRGIELVLPPGVSEAQGQAFLDSRRDWMEAAWGRIRRKVPEAFQENAPESLLLAAIGRRYDLQYRPLGDRLEQRGNVLLVPGPATQSNARCRIKPWLIAQGREILPQWVARVGERTGLAHQRVQVRDQRTRWGSCSARGTISLNFRILFHEARVVDYLILHELCHTRHMNHGPQFRALVARFEPQWQSLDRQLSQAAGGVPGWIGW